MGRRLGMAVSFSLDRGYLKMYGWFFQVAFWVIWGYLKR